MLYRQAGRVLKLYMAGKTTSAGYRLPIVTSGYHEKCIATSVKAIKDVSDKTSDKTYSSGAYRDCNVVAQERIWAEYVQRELKQAKTWEKDWAFITEVDYKGNPRPQKSLPENVSFFTESIPSTTAKQFGSRMNNSNAREILRLEMTTCYRKRKTDLENYYS